MSLEEILVAQFGIYQLLLELTAQERQALLENDLTALADIVAQKEAQIVALAELESARSRAVSAWAEALGLPHNGAPLTLADLLPHLEAATATRLDSLGNSILVSIHELGRQSQSIRPLIETALDRASALRAFLIDLVQEQPGYTANGVRAEALAADSLMVDREL